MGPGAASRALPNCKREEHSSPDIRGSYNTQLQDPIGRAFDPLPKSVPIQT